LSGCVVAVVVGNPRAASRTAAAAAYVGRRIASLVAAPEEPLLVDLADHSGRIFDPADAELTRLTKAVAGSACCVFASPTYKASCTGLLKAFLDRYGDRGLRGMVAVPMMLGAGPTHALAPELHLRPVLVELGATVPTRALYVMDAQLGALDDVVDPWLDEARPSLQALLAARMEAR
jgi:FMN reductase